MKTNVVDVLMYLFENLMSNPELSHQEISLSDLQEAGFDTDEINRAFDWLAIINDHDRVQTFQQPSAHSTRIYDAEEQYCLDRDCLDFLLCLERQSVICPNTRELILQYIACLEFSPISLAQFKRIILIVLLNQPQQEQAANWLQEILRSEDVAVYH